MANLYMIIVSVFFLIVALLHLARIFYGWSAEIGGIFIPLWASWLALVVAGLLAAKGFMTLRKKGSAVTKEHYICTGGCMGVSDHTGTCQAQNCPKHGQQLEKCSCQDGKHYHQ